MEELSLIRLGEKYRLVHQGSNLCQIVNFIRNKYEKCIYVELDTIDMFLGSDKYKDGVYIIANDDDHIRVYQVDTIFSGGYVYNSVYRDKTLIDEYMVIESEESKEEDEEEDDDLSV
jgi:hypothetical protein